LFLGRFWPLLNQFLKRSAVGLWNINYRALLSISSTLNVRIFHTKVFFLAAFLVTFWLWWTYKSTFVRKICTFNIDEIDTWRDKVLDYRHYSIYTEFERRKTNCAQPPPPPTLKKSILSFTNEMFLIGNFEEVNGLDRSLEDRKMSSRYDYEIFISKNMFTLRI